jgi:hypothetical protein
VVLEPVVIGRNSVVGPLVHVVPPLQGECSSTRNKTWIPVVAEGGRLHTMSSTERSNGFSTSVSSVKNSAGSFTPRLSHRAQFIGLLIVLVIHSLSVLPSIALVI